MDDYIKKIVNTIVFALHEKGISATKIENELGLGNNTISMWKRGTKPTVEKLIKVVKYLDISIDEIICDAPIKDNYICEVDEIENANKVFIDLIKQVLKKRKISIKKMCADMELSQQTFFNWEKGTQVPMNRAIQMIKYLNLSADEIFDTSAKNNNYKIVEESENVTTLSDLGLSIDELYEINLAKEKRCSDITEYALGQLKLLKQRIDFISESEGDNIQQYKDLINLYNVVISDILKQFDKKLLSESGVTRYEVKVNCEK